MVSYTAAIGGIEHEARFVRFLDTDPRYPGRKTVTLLLALPYETVKALFSAPGAWSVVSKFPPSVPGAEPEPDVVTDCTDYDVLCHITDHLDGLLEVTIGTLTDKEVADELLEALTA